MCSFQHIYVFSLFVRPAGGYQVITFIAADLRRFYSKESIISFNEVIHIKYWNKIHNNLLLGEFNTWNIIDLSKQISSKDLKSLGVKSN